MSKGNEWALELLMPLRVHTRYARGPHTFFSAIAAAVILWIGAQ